MAYNNILYNALNFKYHGNYCGPGWSAGKYQDSVDDPSVRPVDALDAACMRHDAAYAKAKKWSHKPRFADQLRNRADAAFVKETEPLGVKAQIARAFIGLQQKVASVSNLPDSEEMPGVRGVRRRLEYDEHTEEGSADKWQKYNPPNDSALAAVKEYSKEVVAVENEANGMRSMGASSGGRAYKETQISVPPTITYGLQETHTTILPLTTYFSYASLRGTEPIVYDIALTDVYNPIIDSLTSAPAGGTWTFGKNFYNRPIISSSTGISQPIADTSTFPNTSDVPAWWNYWKTLYDFYAVLSCEYHIQIISATTSVGADAIVGYTTQSGGNRIQESISIKDLECIKEVHFEEVMANTTSNQGRHVAHIRGTYKPGQTRRNVVNDDDTRTWTPTNQSPSLDERLSLFFYGHPLQSTNDTTVRTNGNVRVSLKYVVQFKDLKDHAKFPSNTIGSSIVTTLPADAIMPN